MDKFVYLNDTLSCITVYRDVVEDKVVTHFRSMIKQIVSQSPDFNLILSDYGFICNALYHSEYKGSLTDYLFDKILISNNLYTLYCANSAYSMVPTVVKSAVSFDLNTLYILANLTSAQIFARLNELFEEKESVIALLPSYINEGKKFKTNDSWGNCLTMLADFHRKNGMSAFAKYNSFYYCGGALCPIENENPITLGEIEGYSAQKQALSSHTLDFVSKNECGNVLICGSNGASLLSALLNEYKEKGLRIIGIKSKDLSELNNIIEKIRDIPLRFIIFTEAISADNVSLLNTLSDSLYAPIKNAVIYATTCDKISSDAFEVTVDLTNF